nr:TonB-dependent receptor [uncultured Desulfobulbus sp.]
MKKRVLAIAPLVAFLPTLVLAAEQETTVMDEVVVTATKTKKTRKEVVNAVVIKESYDIEESPASSLGELLANEPGLDWRTYGNYGGAAEAIQIRGMSADATLVAVDGMVINSPSLGSADVGQISLNSIERVEVVKGPGSLLYGSGAMGGTVNIITKSPNRDHFDAKVEAGYGTENSYHLAAENGGFIIGDLGYYLTLNRKETDGFRDNSDLTHNDATLKLLLDKGTMFKATLDAGLVDREYGLPGLQPPAGTAPYRINGVTLYNSDSAFLLDRGEDENKRVALTLQGEPGDWFDWRVKGDYSDLNSTNYSRPYYYAGGGTYSDVTNTNSGVEGNLNLHPWTSLNLLLGNEYRNYDYSNFQQSLNTSGHRVAGALVDEDHQVYTNGTFGELSFQPIDMAKITGGYRYEKHSMFGHEDVLRFGAVVTPLQDMAIKFNRGQHYKAPTLNDLFWPDDGGTKGNTDLKPETGWHTDITLEQGGLLQGKLFASVSWFDWDVNDKISWAEDPSQPTSWGGYYWVPSNVDSYNAQGWEFNVKLGPFSSILADFSLTLIDAEEQLNGGATRDARYTPETQFKAQLTHLSDFGLTSTLTARYTGSRPGYYATNTDSKPQVELASYWTIDLKLEQTFAEHWKVTLQAMNLLDQDYDTYVGTFYPTYTLCAYPGAGRSLFASLSYTW